MKMKTWTLVSMMLLLMVTCGITKVKAAGLGVYSSIGSGSGDWDIEFDSGTKQVGEQDNDRAAIGFVFDSAVARNQLFNYRLNAGYDRVEYDVTNKTTSAKYQYESDRFVLSQDFGFAVLRKKLVRLWIGPELKLAFETGERQSDTRYEVGLFEAGVGPVIGANFNFGPVFTLGLKAGYLFEGFVGIEQFDPTSVDWEVTGTNQEVFFNLSAIFRIRDSYN
ncbi:hypothetical protein ACFL6U_07230 [Planctomycetota bacterium]